MTASKETSGILRLNNLRVSKIYVTPTDKNDYPYNILFGFPKDGEEYKKIKAKLGEISLAKWDDRVKEKLKIITSNAKDYCFIEELTDKSGEFYEGMENFSGLKSNCKRADPYVIVTQDNHQIIKKESPGRWLEEAEKFYPGCRVNAVVNLWAQDSVSKSGTPALGLRCSFMVIQFAGDGQRLSSGAPSVNVEDYFDIVKSENSTQGFDSMAFSESPEDGLL